MTLEPQKWELITWITAIQDEDLLGRIEDFRDPESEIPEAILALLHDYSAAKPEDCMEHTNVRKLLGRK